MNLEILKNRLLPFNWREKGKLLIPKLTKSPFSKAESQFVHLYIVYRDIFNETKSFNDLKKHVESIPIEPALILLSKMNLLLNTPDFRSGKLQKSLVGPLFPENLRNRIMEKLDSTEEVTLFAHHRQILFLQKQIILHSSVGGENTDLTEQDRYAIGMALLMTNEVLDADFSKAISYDGPKEEKRQKTLLWGLKNMMSSSSEQALHLIARYYEIFHNLPLSDDIRASDDFKVTDFDSVFNEATGLPLDMYIFLGVAVYGAFAQYTGKSINEPFNIGDETFNQVADPQIRQAAFSQFTADYHLAKKELSKDEAIHENETYALMTFRKYPLFRLSGNRVICLSPQFLVEKISSGIYWIVFDYLKEKDQVRWKAFPEVIWQVVRTLHTKPLFKNVERSNVSLSP